MYCKHCGAVLDDDALFCESCGALISKRKKMVDTEEKDKALASAAVNSSEVNAADGMDASRQASEAAEVSTRSDGFTGQAEETAAHPAEPLGKDEEAWAQPVNTAAYSAETVNTGEESRAQILDAAVSSEIAVPAVKKKKISPILILLAVIAAAATITAVILTGGKARPVIKADLMAQNNFNNGAVFAYDASRLYFVEAYNADTLVNDLYSTDYDGNDKKLLFSDGDVRKVRVTEGKVLFSYRGKKDEDKEHFTLAMMNPDGTEKLVIAEADSEIIDFDLNGDELLYVVDSGLHSCSLDGQDDKELVSDVKSFINAGSMLYYVSSDGVYSFIRKNGKSEKLIDGEAQELCCEDGRFYYKTEDTYYVTSEDGRKTKLLEEPLSHYMLVRNNYVYFVQMFTMDELNMYLGEDWTENESIAMIGIGKAIRVPKEGGAKEELGKKNSEKMILGATLFGYPEGMYTRLSLVLNLITPVENVPVD